MTDRQSRATFRRRWERALPRLVKVVSAAKLLAAPWLALTLQWFWAYVTFRPSARLITGDGLVGRR